MKTKLKKYPSKWTFKKSRFVFILRVILLWLRGNGGILYAVGIHYIDGVTGGGKTLLMNIIRQELLKKGGFGWTNIDEFKNSYQWGENWVSVHGKMIPFDLEKLFNDGKQIFKLPKVVDGQRCKLMTLDELNALFNRRSNKQKDYNDIFIPLLKMLLTHRHRIADRVYLLGQSMLMQDTQFQQILKYRHFVKPSKRWRYWFYREKNVTVLLPKKLIIESMVKTGTEPNGNAIWSKPKKMKIKVYPQDFLSYDTHAFAKLDDGLPDYK